MVPLGASEQPVIAQPLDSRDSTLPENVRDILDKGKHSWLKNTEVCDMLLNHTEFNLRVAKEPPRQPPGDFAKAVARLQIASGIQVQFPRGVKSIWFFCQVAHCSCLTAKP